MGGDWGKKINIYAITWDLFGDWTLSAAVIAYDEAQAIDVLDLPCDAANITTIEIGICTDGSIEPRIIDEERL